MDLSVQTSVRFSPWEWKFWSKFDLLRIQYDYFSVHRRVILDGGEGRRIKAIVTVGSPRSLDDVVNNHSDHQQSQQIFEYCDQILSISKVFLILLNFMLMAIIALCSPSQFYAQHVIGGVDLPGLSVRIRNER